MSIPNFYFTSLEIRRMPGFPRGDLKVDHLSAGVNVIYGPNASGKTTLGRVMQRILRPHDSADRRESLLATFQWNDTPVQFDYDVGHVQCQRTDDGTSLDCPKLAPPEIGNRHVLALQDLIRSEDDRDLAGAIVRELAGGYDLGEAKQTLQYRDRPSARGKLTREYEAVSRELQQARNQQDALVAQEAKLAALRKAKEEAHDAQLTLGRLQRAADHLEAKRAADSAQVAIDAWPAQVAKISPHDVDRLDEWLATLEAERRNQDAAQRALDSSQQAISRNDSVDTPIDSETVSVLRLKCQRLVTLHSVMSQNAKDANQAAAVVEEAQRILGVEQPADGVEEVTSKTTQGLFAFLRRVEKHTADADAAEATRAWLGSDQASDEEEPEQLRDAIRLLRDWLGSPDVETLEITRVPVSRVVFCSVLAGLSLLMGLAAHTSWFLLMPIALGAIAWLLWPRPAAVVDDPRKVFQTQYARLPLPSPDAWSQSQVAGHLRSLERQRDRLTVAEERALRWDRLSDRRESLERQAQELDDTRRHWAERLGLDLDTSDPSIVLWADNLRRYQEARARNADAEAAVQVAGNTYGELLDEVNQLLTQHGLAPADDPESASARVETLEERRQQVERATAELQRSREALHAATETIAALEARRDTLFALVGLAHDDEGPWREWAAMRTEYDKAAERLRIAEARVSETHGLAKEFPQLIDLTEEELAGRRQSCEEAAAQLGPVSEEIGAIESDVRQAKQSTDLESKLAGQEIAADALRMQREADYDALVGHVLADFVAKQEHEHELPGVLRRARELFTRITHGRYELHVHEGDPPQFRAFDTARNEGLALEELSSGTRLQLLLAVRVAFVERQEQGIKVPLILDETLGNSDERRAREIIEAVIEICRDGRQVFYFTAQHDEVGKWQSLLAAHEDLPSRLIDLAEVRNFSQTERALPMKIEPPQAVPVPSPDGRDWHEYGVLLDVPPVDPRGEIGEVHLWYLIDDPTFLHRLLVGGVNKWGQLKTLVAYRDIEGLSQDAPPYVHAEASARMLEEIFKAWRIGRGQPVDRAALTGSEAISATYIDRVADLATDLSGDAGALLDALDAGKVRGFRKDKRLALEEYFATEGYLDTKPQLSTEEVLEQVTPILFPEIDAGHITTQRIEQLVRTVVG